MAAEDQTGHGRTEGTMARRSHCSNRIREDTWASEEHTQRETRETQNSVRSSKLSLRVPGVPEAIFMLDSKSQNVSVDLLCVSRIYCISLITITSKEWVSIASCLHYLPWSLTLDVLHTVIDMAPKTVSSECHSLRHGSMSPLSKFLKFIFLGLLNVCGPNSQDSLSPQTNTCLYYQKYPPMLFLQKSLHVFLEYPLFLEHS